MIRWLETDKGDQRCRELADRHYTRISVGHPMPPPRTPDRTERLIAKRTPPPTSNQTDMWIS